jgi:hypothetical protein
MGSRPVSVLGAAALAATSLALVAPSARADSYSYVNPAPILPPDNGVAGESATITVAGTVGPVTDVNVQLRGVTSMRPTELDVAITGPNGQTVAVMSDACGNTSYPITDLTFTFDDDANVGLPLTTCSSGTFRPTDYSDVGADPWAVPPTGTALSLFDGASANGVWTLRVYDVGPSGIAQQITKGFALEIQTQDLTSPDTTVTKKPRDSRRARAKIKFTSTEAGAHFECKVGKRPFKPCTSPLRLKKLSIGTHKVKVRAVDAAGNVDPTPAKVTWRVLAHPERP